MTLYAVDYGGYNKTRQDVSLEGETKVSGWDIGPKIGTLFGTDEPPPWQRTATVEVTDGTLNVAVTPDPNWYPGRFDYTMLSAIKVEELE